MYVCVRMCVQVVLRVPAIAIGKSKDEQEFHGTIKPTDLLLCFPPVRAYKDASTNCHRRGRGCGLA
eukprot:5587747-Amphidinium_carterae.1